MVFFICNHCGESAKKASVEKHYLGKCRQFAKSLSCMDCQKDFHNQEFEAHTKCISEEQKYSGKDFVPKASQNSGEKKQECWTEIIRSILDSKVYEFSKETRSIFQRLQSYENVPRKQVKFLNFVGNSLRLKPHQVEEAWTILEKELDSMKLAKQKEKELSKVVAEQAKTSDEKPPLEDCNTKNPESESKKSESKKKKKKNREVDEQNVTELCLAEENGLGESKVNVEENSKIKKKSKKRKSEQNPGDKQNEETNGQEETQEPTDEPVNGDLAANENKTEDDCLTKNVEGELKKDKSKKKKKNRELHANGFHQETTEICSKEDNNLDDSKIAAIDGGSKKKSKSKKRKSGQSPDEEQSEKANNAEANQESNEKKLKKSDPEKVDIIKSENGDVATDSKTKKKSKKRKLEQPNNEEEAQKPTERKLKKSNSDANGISKTNQFDWHSAICKVLKEKGEKLKENRLKDEVFKMYTEQLNLKSPSKRVMQKFKKNFFGSLSNCGQVRVEDGVVTIL